MNAWPQVDLTLDDLGEEIARGRTAEVYALPGERVLKLFNAGVPAQEAESEARANQAVRAAGLRAPALFAVATVGDRHGLIFARIRGAHLLEQIGAAPAEIDAVAVALADLHAAMHRHSAPALRSVHESLAWSIQHAPLADAVRTAALASLARLPAADRLCHMDFHPYQVICVDDERYIVDWLTARQGAPAADVARTALLLTMARIEDARLAWLNQGLLRSALAHRYVNHYCRVTGMTVAEIEPWFYPLAAARRAEVDDDNPQMLAFLEAGAQVGRAHSQPGSEFREFTGIET